MQIIPVSQARKNLPDLVNKAYTNNQEFVITKGGIPMAKIIKASKIKTIKKVTKKDIKAAMKIASSIDGIWNEKRWKNKSSVEIVNYLRKKAWYSHAR